MKLPEQTSILIIDDNLNFIKLLTTILQDIGVEKVCGAPDFRTALTKFSKEAFDALIIDIELNDPQGNGIALAKAVRQSGSTIPILFMTSFYTEAHYEKCRVVNPSSFMNKDLSHFKIMQALDIALMRKASSKILPLNKRKPTLNKKSKSLASPSSTAKSPFVQENTYFFKVGDKFQSFAIEDILFFFAKDKLTFARIEHRNYPTNVQLKVLEKSLFPVFLRIHKTYLVKQSKIEHINFKDSKVKIGEEILPIGFAYKKEFMRQINLLK